MTDDDDDIRHLDPDRERVPEQLLEAHGEPAFLLAADGVADGMLFVSAGALRDRRGLREDTPP